MFSTTKVCWFYLLTNVPKYLLKAYYLMPGTKLDTGDKETEVILYPQDAHNLTEKANKEIVMIQREW